MPRIFDSPQSKPCHPAAAKSAQPAWPGLLLGRERPGPGAAPEGRAADHEFGSMSVYPPPETEPASRVGEHLSRGLTDSPIEDNEVIRGIGDVISDVFDVVGTGVGNVIGGAAALLTGTSIASATTAGPVFGPQGAAMWHVAFSTSERTGWIVQEVSNSLNGTDTAGAAMTPATVGLAPHYFEAWSVDAAGAVTPKVGAYNDQWDQGGMGAGTSGHWSTTGALYWLPGAGTPAGMAPGTVPNAGILVSSLAEPAGLGVARLHRYAHANWDATAVPAVDTGSAA